MVDLFFDWTSRVIVQKEMAGKFSKLKRIVGLFSVLSMLATSVAACACSHHSADLSNNADTCHSHSESTHNDRQTIADQRREAISGSECSCPQASPRLVFKQDQKDLLVKLPIVRSTSEDPEIVVIADAIGVDNFDTPTLIRSFLRSSILGRAPPRPNFA